MRIPIRIKEYKLNSSKTRFDLWGGIKSFFHNLKVIFTSRLLTGGTSFMVSDDDITILRDISLMRDVDTGEYKFITTPSGQHQTSLEITQNIRD